MIVQHMAGKGKQHKALYPATIYHCRNMMDCHAAVLYPLPKTTHPFRRERAALKKANLCLPTKVRFFVRESGQTAHKYG